MNPPGREHRISRRTLFRGRVIDLHVDQIRTPKGEVAIREVAGHRPAVAVVPLLRDGRVVLIRQYRYAAGRFFLEIPAGLIDSGENPRQAAARELAEETGYRATTWQRIGAIYSSPGFTPEKIHLYLASGLCPGPRSLDEDEWVETHPVPLQQALAWVQTGKIVDAKTMVGLMLADQKKSGRQSVRSN